MSQSTAQIWAHTTRLELLVTRKNCIRITDIARPSSDLVVSSATEYLGEGADADI
jgi:hypothetical protein